MSLSLWVGDILHTCTDFSGYKIVAFSQRVVSHLSPFLPSARSKLSKM
ncbi:hypothetical protein HHE06_07490 [Helicobacter heilmannii]|nr:hypothetical protein HHE06_07490 [Helicobacter heilmannii]